MKHTVDIIVRQPAATIAHSSETLRGIPDYARAALQHQQLLAAIEAKGIRVERLDASAGFADGSLTDDLAVVTETVAVLAQMGRGHPRAPEQQALANLLAQDRILKFISPPGLMCGRDVARVGDHFYIGLSNRTNEEGAAQLAFFLKEFGYDATTLANLPAQTHLKNALAALPGGKTLIRDDLALHYALLGLDKITVAATESAACCGITLANVYFMPAGLVEAPRLLKEAGIPLCEVNVSEFEKTGAGLSSLVLPMPRVLREKAAVVLPLSSKKQAAA